MYCIVVFSGYFNFLVISRLDHCNSVFAGLPASTLARWRLCNSYKYKMRLLDLCLTSTSRRITQHYSSCTGCLSSTASALRSRRWCTTFYTIDVRRISPTWLHSTRQTLNDVNSGRRIPELQSWNGHGPPNSANAPSQLVVPVYGTVFLQQSATLIVILRLDEIWSNIYSTVFLLHNFYPCILLTVVMQNGSYTAWLGTIKTVLSLKYYVNTLFATMPSSIIWCWRKL